jgi:hypothetical protein
LKAGQVISHEKQTLVGAEEDADVNSQYWAQVHFNLFTLFVGCVWQLAFMFGFFWIMLINVPSLNWNGATFEQLGGQMHDGFGCFFGGGTPTCQRGLNTLYGLTFNFAYFAGYIASIYLNLINLPLSMISSQLQGPLVAVALLVFPALDLNNTGAQAYSVLPALVLQVAALVVYEYARRQSDNNGDGENTNSTKEKNRRPSLALNECVA